VTLCRVCQKRPATVTLGGICAKGPGTERGLLGEAIERLCFDCFSARTRADLDQAMAAFRDMTDGPRGEPRAKT